MKPRKMTLILASMLFLGVLSVLEFSSVAPVAASISGWETWQNWKFVNFSETMGVSRVNEPVDIFITFDTPTPVDDIRVLDPSLNEVPSQVYNVALDGDGNCTSANIAFLVNCSASDYVTYTVLYNNLTACQPPVYDGLRLYANATAEEWNVTALKGGVEKNYFYLFWRMAVNLYSNGKLVTWAGGPLGWNFSQIGLGTLWADAYGTPWFGASSVAIVSVLNSGPLLVEINYTEPYASDLLGTVFDYNVSTGKILRVWYQPDLKPLVSCRSSFFINPVSPVVNYTINTPYYLDFKLANSTRQAIYQDFTWRNATGTYTVPTNTTPGVEVEDNMGGGVSPIGWWSYNGSRPDSSTKPAANMGLIPTYSGGTNTTWDYTLQFTAQDYEYGNHHCSQYFGGSFNGVAGDKIETEGYIVTYGSNAEPYMSDKATKLRNPLGYQVSDERASACFRLVTLYTVHLDVNGTFFEGSKLRVEFYSYSGIYQANTTVWTGTTPDNVTLSVDIPHPLGWPVEKATLVLTDNLGTILYTATSFVVHRSHLMGRLGELDYLWTVPGADRTAIMKEYVAIDGQWPYAPP